MPAARAPRATASRSAVHDLGISELRRHFQLNLAHGDNATMFRHSAMDAASFPAIRGVGTLNHDRRLIQLAPGWRALCWLRLSWTKMLNRR